MLQADLSLIIPGTDITWEQHVTFAHPVDNTKTKVSILSTKVNEYQIPSHSAVMIVCGKLNNVVLSVNRPQAYSDFA